MNPDKYPDLWNLVVMFGQDYDLFGETVEEIVLAFKKEADGELTADVISQIDGFKKENKNDLDVAFVKTFGELGHVDMWGHTHASFLDEVKRLLQE